MSSSIYVIIFNGRLMTHIARIRGVFDVANSQRYRAGFAPMLFEWSHAHIARFFVAKNRAIKRGLERKNRAIKKSRYVCHGTKSGTFSAVKHMHLNLVYGFVWLLFHIGTAFEIQNCLFTSLI